MKMTIIKEHFPGYLLRVLYSNKVYSSLNHFVEIFDELVDCGCKAPCDLPSLRKFAEADLLGAEVPAIAGDLTSRMRFFSSALYKHFMELRASALETAAKSASDDEKRDGLLKAWYSAAESLEDPSCTDLKSASWARSMLTSSVPLVARVTFALEAESAQRVGYAATFGDGQVGGVSWRSLSCFVDTVDIPEAIGWIEFREAVVLVGKAGLRKQVVNPLVGGFLDFHTEVQMQFGEQTTWVPGLLEAAARAKLGSRHWQEVALAAEVVAEGDIVPLSRMLGKLWPFRAPEWVSSLRDKAAELKQQQRRVAEEAVAAVAPAHAAAVAPGAPADAATETATVAPGATGDQTTAADDENETEPDAPKRVEVAFPTRGETPFLLGK